MYPSIPKAIFDITSWFEIAFPKPQFNWYAENENYDNDIKHWKRNEEKYINSTYGNEYEIKISNTGKRCIKFIHLDTPDENNQRRFSYGDFISCGEWDDPNFTENERQLAWRIECNKENKISKDISQIGTKWQDQEEYELMKAFNLFLETQAEIHRRTPNGIKKMLNKLIK